MSRFILFVILMLLIGCGGGSSGGSSSSCGALNTRIFNGEECNQETRSSVVELYARKRIGDQFELVGFCTGTFISVTSILTSAHCFTDAAAAFGRENIEFVAVTGDGDVFEFSSIYLHGLYSGRAGSPFDIAVARLNRVPSPHISPVPILVSEFTRVGDSVITFGYGTNNLGETGVLKAARMRIASFAVGNIIATLEESGASICPGDSGGPLVALRGGVTTLVGVNSFVDVEGCQGGFGSSFSGFVDLQNQAVVN
jgi:secreted trypsin-like serine protease